MENLWEKFKQGLLLIALGAITSMVPFYFKTSAQTESAIQTNTLQTDAIETTKSRVHELEVKGAVDDVEIRQIKESLDRIEKKIDRLIDNQR